MTTQTDKAILSGADNHPPMLEKDMYDSWKSQMKLYMMNRQHGRMIFESVENGPLLWPTVDYAKIKLDDLIHKLNKKAKEKFVPYPKFISLLLEHMAPEYENKELSINPTQVFSVHNLTLKPNQPKEPPFINHVKAICNLVVHVDFKASKYLSPTEEISQLKLIIEYLFLRIPYHNNRLEDLADILKDTRSAFFTPDSITDEPIIISDVSEEEKNVENDKDTKDTLVPPPSSKSAQVQELLAQVYLLQSHKKELEQAKVKAKAKVASMKTKPSYPNINLLTELLIVGLSREIKEIKQHIKDIEINLSGDLKEIPLKLETFTSTVSNLSSRVAKLKIIQWELPAEFLDLPHLASSIQEKLKTLDSLPGLLKMVINTLNRFTTLVANASEATTTGVPLADKATASPAEGEKNADTNLKNKLVDLFGIDIVTQYYNKKLLYERECEKIKKEDKALRSSVVMFSPKRALSQ
nr:hypothetical protein [Tanacetum cinerariifolium]